MWTHEADFLSALETCGFPADQREALQAAYRAVVACDALRKQAEQDTARLADPNGPRTISRDEGLYPALVLLSRVKWLKEEYARRGMPPKVLRDTLGDIPLWIANCQRHTGQMGLKEYAWLCRYLRLQLVRLGRLEFIHAPNKANAYFFRSGNRVIALSGEGFAQTQMQATGHPLDADGCAAPERMALSLDEWRPVLRPGDPILEVHIPEGPPMSPGEITASLSSAPEFFRRYLGAGEIAGFTCESWLMSPALGRLMPGSNLAAFQARFRIVPDKHSDEQTFERVFGGCKTDWDRMPAATTLQRKIRDWYRSGGHVYGMYGVILADDLL